MCMNTHYSESTTRAAPSRRTPTHRVHKRDRQRHQLLVAAKRLAIGYAKLDCHQLRSRCETLQGRAGDCIERYFRAERQFHRAVRCEYHLAANALVQRCSRSLRDLEHYIRCHMEQLQRPFPSPPSLKSIHQELLAAEDEFGEVEFDLRKNVLSVTTDPIVLEGLDLGRFRIELTISSMTHDGTADWYRIEALDPNPAASDEEVPHPHVQSGKLCSGDAFESIHHTLISGRLSEFFLIVRSVLETYNSQSPFVAIEDWSGRTCYDCDDLVSPDECRYCESCSRDFCDNCASSCYGCDQSYCLNCMRDSEISPHMYCNGCSAICSRCERVGGREELDENLCPACQAIVEQEEDEQPDDPPTTSSNQEPSPHDHQPTEPQADDAGRSVHTSGFTTTDTHPTQRHQTVQPQSGRARSTEIDQTTEEDPAETPDHVRIQENRPAGAEVFAGGLVEAPIPVSRR